MSPTYKFDKTVAYAPPVIYIYIYNTTLNTVRNVVGFPKNGRIAYVKLRDGTEKSLRVMPPLTGFRFPRCR